MIGLCVGKGMGKCGASERERGGGARTANSLAPPTERKMEEQSQGWETVGRTLRDT